MNIEQAESAANGNKVCGGVHHVVSLMRGVSLLGYFAMSDEAFKATQANERATRSPNKTVIVKTI